MSAHMTPLLETALGNGNLHTHLKILFIRGKLFHMFSIPVPPVRVAPTTEPLAVQSKQLVHSLATYRGYQREHG